MHRLLWTLGQKDLVVSGENLVRDQGLPRTGPSRIQALAKGVVQQPSAAKAGLAAKTGTEVMH